MLCKVLPVFSLDLFDRIHKRAEVGCTPYIPSFWPYLGPVFILETSGPSSRPISILVTGHTFSNFYQYNSFVIIIYYYYYFRGNRLVGTHSQPYGVPHLKRPASDITSTSWLSTSIIILRTTLAV